MPAPAYAAAERRGVMRGTCFAASACAVIEPKEWGTMSTFARSQAVIDVERPSEISSMVCQHSGALDFPWRADRPRSVSDSGTRTR